VTDDIVAQLRRGDAYDGETICCKYDRCNCAVMENAAAEIERLRGVLERIFAWQMPPSGRTWEDGTPMSYSAAFGSNGERDLVRQWAADALKV
jgi:hypothetical protein